MAKDGEVNPGILIKHPINSWIGPGKPGIFEKILGLSPRKPVRFEAPQNPGNFPGIPGFFPDFSRIPGFEIFEEKSTKLEICEEKSTKLHPF